MTSAAETAFRDGDLRPVRTEISAARDTHGALGLAAICVEPDFAEVISRMLHHEPVKVR
jgi:hypothetical protein